MSDKQCESALNKLQSIFKAYQDGSAIMNEWEEGFIVDNYARYEKYKERTQLSEKQIEKIEGIYEKVVNGADNDDY